MKVLGFYQFLLEKNLGAVKPLLHQLKITTWQFIFLKNIFKKLFCYVYKERGVWDLVALVFFLLRFKIRVKWELKKKG